MLAFISHSDKDSGIYSALCLALDAARLSRWDPSTMSSGESLAAQLREAIRRCDACVFVATRQSIVSHWCLAEVGAFWGAGKRIFLFMGEPGLSDTDLPPQFKRSLWTGDAHQLIKELAKESEMSAPLIGARPGNVFWLGHDLARAIRFAMFTPHDRDDLEKELRQAIHHLDEVGVVAPDARRLLLSAIKMQRNRKGLSEEERRELVNAIAQAKNEIGNRIADLQPGFRAYATLEGVNRLSQQIQGV